MKEKPFFIGLDSEGFTLATGEHITVLVMASTGELISDVAGISSERIFKFLLSLKRKWSAKKPHFVIYGASYDFNMFLRHIPEDSAREINFKNQQDSMEYTEVLFGNVQYFVHTIPRKNLKIKSGATTIKINDVIGFFQQSFAECVASWLPHVTKSGAYANMLDGKNNRGDFASWNIRDIIEYTRIELAYLVSVMDLLALAIDELDLNVREYYGAGAIAKAMLDKHLEKKFICEKLPNIVEQSSLNAFFGGRIELFKYGVHNAPLYEYDLNSAYPASIKNICPTDGAEWVVKDYDRTILKSLESYSQYSLYNIEWACKSDNIINPFPYRSKTQKKVFYPHSGKGVYHRSEVEAALKHSKKLGLIIWVYQTIELVDNGQRPFDFVSGYYKKRQSIVSESKRTGKANGAEKIIKLGLNSLYGKICQTAGGKTRRPPYHNIFFAGYITACTRAAIFDAAMESPSSIVMAATDGLYSTNALHVNTSDSKELGLWENQFFDGGIFVQSGYYFLDGGGKMKARTRGFDKLRTPAEVSAQIDKIKLFFESGIEQCFFACTRFITLSTACTGENYKKWCTWYEMRQGDCIGRGLKLSPSGTKRDCLESNPLPGAGLVQTYPIINLTPSVISEPYKRGFLDDFEDNKILEELLEDGY